MMSQAHDKSYWLVLLIQANIKIGLLVIIHQYRKQDGNDVGR